VTFNTQKYFQKLIENINCVW